MSEYLDPYYLQNQYLGELPENIDEEIEAADEEDRWFDFLNPSFMLADSDF